MIWLLIGATVVIFIYEFWAAANGKRGDTITEIIKAGAKHPILPLGFGLLMGHFFW